MSIFPGLTPSGCSARGFRSETPPGTRGCPRSFAPDYNYDRSCRMKHETLHGRVPHAAAFLSARGRISREDRTGRVGFCPGRTRGRKPSPPAAGIARFFSGASNCASNRACNVARATHAAVLCSIFPFSDPFPAFRRPLPGPITPRSRNTSPEGRWHIVCFKEKRIFSIPVRRLRLPGRGLSMKEFVKGRYNE